MGLVSSVNRFRLDGKVALVTGASRGIGRAIALGLGQHGAQMALNARGAPALEIAAIELRDAGIDAFAVPGHAARAEDIEQVVDATLDQFGRIDILVNNAATNVAFGPLLSASGDAIRKTFETNVFGPLELTRAVVRRSMQERGGAIVNVASVAGLRAREGLGAYGASKAAVIQLTRSLARELAPLEIRANAIAPAVIRTSFATALSEDDAVRNTVETQAALGRIGEAEEVVGAAVYLASPASRYVTGHVLLVDGGTMA